jgi:multicomponent Na+:H+ antiporter subunit G
VTGDDVRGALSVALIGAGMLFFLAGSIGVLRLPDLLSRLHALTKADNLGLGLVVLGLMLQADDAFEVVRLLLVWLLVLFASSVACYLVAHSATNANRDLTPTAGPDNATAGMRDGR